MKLRPGDLVIDPGSVNSLVAVDGGSEGPRIESVPSLVTRYTRSGNLIAVGKDAAPYVGRSPNYIETVGPIMQGRIKDKEAFITLVKHLVELAIPGYRYMLGKPTALIAVPKTTPMEMGSLKKLVEAHLKIKVLLIPQQGAAAIGAGLQYKGSVTCTVADIGGSTTDLATLANSVPSFQESIGIGGNDFDEAIQRKMLRESHHLRISAEHARNIKHQLGSLIPFADGERSADVYGIPLSNGNVHSGKAVLTSQEVREWLLPVAETLCTYVNDKLGEITSESIFGDIAQHGGVVTGGGAELYGLPEFVSKRINRKFVKVEDPFKSVIVGGIEIMNSPALRKTFDLLLEH